MRIVSVGEVLWDVIEGEEHLGGAPFNFAAHATRLGHEVRFISAVGQDERGKRVLERMSALGMDAEFVSTTVGRETGVVTVELKQGQPKFTIHRPAAYDYPRLDEQQLAKLSAWQPEWIYFGTLAQMSVPVRQLTKDVIGNCGSARRFYDVNLREGCHTQELVRELLAEADVLKLNDFEMNAVGEVIGWRSGSAEEFSRAMVDLAALEGVCVTRGERGCTLLLDGVFVEHDGFRVTVADAVGAGDAFAAALVHGIGERWPVMQIAAFCNGVGALVASRRGAIPAWSVDELGSLRQT